jgi:murein L,D-transpeptidase YcbB/YkuD
VLAAGLALLGAPACRNREAAVAATAPPSAPAAQPALVEPAAADPAVLAAVAEVLERSRHPWLRWPDLADVGSALRTVYDQEPDRLFWFAGERTYPALGDAVRALSASAERGLTPADYDHERIGTQATSLDAPGGAASARALFDLAVTVSVLRAIDAVHRGRVDPRTLGWGYDLKPKELDRPALLRDARASGGITALLDRLEPSFPHYARNRKTLAHYRTLVEAGEPEAVPPLPKGRTKVEAGQAWAGASALAVRLRLIGDLAPDEGPAATADGTPLYAGALVDAVKRFQARHILDADGVVGKGTIEALNVPVRSRLRQLELAMERGRWLPRLNERPTVFVNVPIFRLWASDPIRGDEPLRMKVVVGKSMKHQTPLFVERMEYVVFRPYWNPPYGIASREIVPHARRDPAYLDRENIEIVASGDERAPALPATPENLDAIVAGRLFVRQKPGPKNSLGLAKFIFPNRENVYMHGTPAPQLFARTRRDFSHGCIRLEDPGHLAEWVLRDQPEWTRERIEAAMQGDRPTRVDLKEPLAVVLFYDTVHVNSDGVVHFVGDIYGHDRRLDAALARGYPYLQKQ